MSRSEPRARARVWLVLSGRAAQGGGQFLLLAGVAHLGQPGALGDYSLALAITAPIIVLANMQLRTFYASDIANRFHWGTYLRLRLILAGLALTAIVAVALSITTLRLIWATVALVGLARCTEMVADLFHGVFQRSDRFDRYSRSLLIRYGTSVSAALLALYTSRSLSLALGAAAVASLLTLSLFDIKQTSQPNTDPGLKTSQTPEHKPGFTLLKLAFPVAISSLTAALADNVPRYALEIWVGREELGAYSAMAYVNYVGTILAFSGTVPLVTPLAKAIDSRDRSAAHSYVRRILFRAAAPGLLGLLAVPFGNTLLTLAYGPQVAARSDVFYIILTGGLFQYLGQSLQQIFVVMRRIRTLAALQIFSLSVGCVVAYSFVPSHGILGASLALLSSTLSLTTLSLIAYFRISPNEASA